MKDVVVFGAGEIFKKYAKMMNRVWNIMYVCDNDRSKWGRTYVRDWGGRNCFARNSEIM